MKRWGWLLLSMGLISLGVMGASCVTTPFVQVNTNQLIQTSNQAVNAPVSEPVIDSMNTIPVEQPTLVYPIQNFVEQATLKLFGTYITPQTSPVQPERFQGYHNAIDVETTTEQQAVDVPIYAIADGTITRVAEVDGYGGLLIMTFELEGQTYTALYGHLRLSSISVVVGDQARVGQSLGVLGSAYSTETDGERKHLHFSLQPGISTNLRGYVSSTSSLSGWIDPLIFFQNYQAQPPIEN